MIAFKSNYYVFGELLKPNEKYKVSFEYNGVASDISHISPQCGCTAEIDKKDGIITAVYTENVAAGVDNETSASIYPNGIVPFQKNINVFVEDKEDLYVQDGMNKVINPQKEVIKLTIAGFVKII